MAPVSQVLAAQTRVSTPTHAPTTSAPSMNPAEADTPSTRSLPRGGRQETRDPVAYAVDPVAGSGAAG